MKRYVAVLLAAALTALTGCGTAVNSSDIPSTVEAAVESAAPPATEDSLSESAAPAQEQPAIAAGIWESSSGDTPTGYYVIYGDGSGGCTISFETGTGVAFEYEFREDSVTFFMGAADAPVRFAITSLSGTEAVFTAEDGSVLSLRYSGEGGAESLPFFYTDMELAQLAGEYYERTNGAAPPRTSMQTEPDGNVTIHLYESLSDHTATWVRYSVNRFTGEAEDIVLCKPIEDFIA